MSVRPKRCSAALVAAVLSFAIEDGDGSLSQPRVRLRPSGIAARPALLPRPEVTPIVRCSSSTRSSAT